MRGLVILAAALTFARCSAWEIEHVVFLVMENQPFDKFYCYAQEELGDDIDGLTGDECFAYDKDDASKGTECVGKGQANFVCENGGTMGYSSMVDEIFGVGNWDGITRPYPEQTQDGWMQVTKEPEVIAQFEPEQTIIHTTLAEEFGVFNQYYTSFPGPSTPNHLFLMSATSNGCTNTGEDYQCKSGATFPQKTIFENLQNANKTWRYFYNDTTWNYFLEFFNTPEGAAGILPRQGANETTGQGSNDDHPCHDIALGELLIKQTYEALRAGPAWNKTLLFVTYDDTGGWYDHQPVPVGIPAPDDQAACGSNTDFTWLGLRAPALLISPWISKGKVIQKPNGPEHNSEYEHSSLSATLKGVFDLPEFLTKRDAWAGDFSNELDLDEPRTDCPMHLPDAPPPTTDAAAVHGGIDYDDDLTRRQRRRVLGISRAVGVDAPQDMDSWSHADAEKYIAKMERIHRDNARVKREEF